jgi:MarR family transcriptional regulator for hemolysin
MFRNRGTKTHSGFVGCRIVNRKNVWKHHIMEQSGAPTTDIRTVPSWRRVEIALIDTARRVRTAFDVRLAPLDLNLNQASLLAFVADFGDCNQTRLAELVGVGRAAAGSIVDQLEARGLVVLNPDPDDRRAWLVGCTPAGRDLIDQFYAVDADLRKELRSGISREERQQLASLLERLGNNVEAITNPHVSNSATVGGGATGPDQESETPHD